MIVYSENGKIMGSTRSSLCGCTTELVVTGEPWRTMLQNTLSDYALEMPIGGEGYRLDADGDHEGRWLVKAQSALQKGLLVDVAEVVEDAEGRAVLSLLRIRPQYAGRRERRRAKSN